jgi:hypothetical protein
LGQLGQPKKLFIFKHIEFTREMLKDQLKLLKLNFAKM